MKNGLNCIFFLYNNGKNNKTVFVYNKKVLNYLN